MRPCGPSLLVLGVLAAMPIGALAQPKPTPESGDKTDAKALMASGLKLFRAKDYLGALTVFREAYTRFPSSKILLNIATTLKQLDRKAEAANTYQRYLDSDDADPAKRADVNKAIAALDVKVGILELTVKPPDAEVQLAGEDEWHPARDFTTYRVTPGTFTVRARGEQLLDGELSGEVAPGKRLAMTLTLAPVPKAPLEPAKRTAGVTTGGEVVDDGEDGGSGGTATTKFGAYVLAHIDVANGGGAARIGATFEVIPRLQLEVGGLIGPSPGAYAGARYAFLPGRFRPVLAVGAPVFIEDGARVALRGAAALEIVLSPRISIVAEVGVERLLNAGMNYVDTMFVPAIGAAGRL